MKKRCPFNVKKDLGAELEVVDGWGNTFHVPAEKPLTFMDEILRKQFSLMAIPDSGRISPVKASGSNVPFPTDTFLGEKLKREFAGI